LAGKLLMSDKADMQKLKTLVGCGCILLMLGFGLDWSHVTPIIKRTATSSFVLASAGWVVLFLSLSYWWVDIKKHRKYLFLFNLFALNSIFIYLFNEIVGDRWFTGYILDIANGLFGIIHIPILLSAILASLVVFAADAGILYFLYKKKIFFKL
jgi:predicted acyltransferase